MIILDMNNIKPLVALDLVGVLEDSWDAKRRWLKRHCGKDFGSDAVRANGLGLSDREMEEMLNDIYSGESVASHRLMPGARHGLAKLRPDFSFAVVTSRPERLREPTENWLKQNGLWNLLGRPVLLGDGRFQSTKDQATKSKLAWCVEKNAAALVDDSPEKLKPRELIGGSEEITKILFEYGEYDTTGFPEGVLRVRSWPELVEVLHSEKYLLKAQEAPGRGDGVPVKWLPLAAVVLVGRG